LTHKLQTPSNNMIGRLSVEKTLAASTEGDANAALHLLLACFCLGVATCLCCCDADLNAGKRTPTCWFNAATIANPFTYERMWDLRGPEFCKVVEGMLEPSQR